MSHEVLTALIIQSDMILLGRRSPTRSFYPDVWDVFGGHVEPGEQHPQTLVRELQEELGITPTQWTFLETLTLPLPAHDNETADQLTVHLYLVTTWTGRPGSAEPPTRGAQRTWLVFSGASHTTGSCRPNLSNTVCAIP